MLKRSKFNGALAKASLTVEQALTAYKNLATVVQAQHLAGAVIADLDDDAVLAAALTGQAQYLVSGDKHLLAIGSYKGIRIVTAATFLEIIAAATEEE